MNCIKGNIYTLPITSAFRQASPSLVHITPLKVSPSQYTGWFIGKIVPTYS